MNQDLDSNSIYTCDVDTAKLLIFAGINVNMVNSNGETPLHKACFEKAKLIIDAGADVNIIDKNGDTALTNCDEFDKIKLLIQAGAIVNSANRNGESILHKICEVSYYDYDYFDDDEYHLTLRADKIRIVKLLIATGANIDAVSKYGTPLRHASSEITKVLITAGANPDIFDKNGETSLHKGNNWIREELDLQKLRKLKVFIAAGVNLNIVDKNGQTPLFGANVEKTKLLIAGRTDLDVRDNDRNTSLQYANSKRHCNRFYNCSECGLDLEGWWNEDKSDPNAEKTKLLIEAGADIELISLFSSTSAKYNILVDAGISDEVIFSYKNPYY
jgi:ankyrin repeat protein